LHPSVECEFKASNAQRRLPRVNCRYANSFGSNAMPVTDPCPVRPDPERAPLYGRGDKPWDAALRGT
jgi:hypothetical protein